MNTLVFEKIFKPFQNIYYRKDLLMKPMKDTFRKNFNVKRLNLVFLFIAVFLVTSLIITYLSGDPRRDRATHTQGLLVLWGNLTLVASVIFLWFRRNKTWYKKNLQVQVKQLIGLVILVAAILLNGFYYVVTHPVKPIRPLLVYQVDSSDNQISGTVTDKRIKGEAHLLELNDSGTYWMVPKNVYDKVNIGDPAPDFLTGK